MENPSVISLAEARAAEERRGVMANIHAQLAKSDRMVPLGTVSNLILIIAQDPTLSTLFGYNEFTSSTVIHAPAPAPLDDTPPVPGPYPRSPRDTDFSYVQSYIQRVWTKHASQDATCAAVFAVAEMRRFHPVRDWLDTLVWDGVDRLDSWLVNAFGAPADAYTADVGAKFLIAAVRRIRQPGCKFDHMPVLEGPQGIGKSTVIRALFGSAWATDSIPAKLESADAALCLQGVWCVEFAEIEQLIRTEVEVIKAFLSRSTDRFRAPYGRAFLTYPRQCVLVGTTNESDYLRDATGNRRFWPVQCPQADPVWVADNRDQLWAEAVYRETDGEEHWLSRSEVVEQATKHQAERLQDDPWQEKIVSYLEYQSVASVPDILTNCLNMAIIHQSKREQMRVAAILKKEGWLRKLRRTGPGGIQVVRQWQRGGFDD